MPPADPADPAETESLPGERSSPDSPSKKPDATESRNFAQALTRSLPATKPPAELADTLPGGASATHAPETGTSAELKLPCRFGDYDLLAEFGKGGMGVVYKARQRSANRIVALKLIRPDQLSRYLPEERRQVLARFRNEVQAAAQLEHDHVVTVYDVGEIDGQSYYAMRFVDGESLKDRLDSGPLEPEVAARYIEQVARALAEAHARGILHRDLKPHNVMLDTKTDRALLADFGLAKLAEGDQQLTASSSALGSPPYMSPEQTLDSGKVTSASDIYGLGATLYHLLTGRPPFQAANATATMMQVQIKDPVSPRELNPAVPLDLETICLKCLEKEAEKRYASAPALAEELGRFLRHEPILARPLGPTARFWRWCQRHREIASLSAVLLISLLIGLVGTSSFAWIANGERIRANQEAATAKMKTKETALALENANEQKHRVERKLYAAGIASAYRAWLYGDARRASYHLEAVDAQQRGWEHRFVSTLIHPEIRRTEVVYNDLASCREQDLLATCYADGVKLVRKSTGEVIREYKEATDDFTTAVAISGDGKWLACGGRTGFVSIRDVATGRVEFHSQVHSRTVNVLEFSPDSLRLLSSGAGDSPRVMNIPTGELVHDLAETRNLDDPVYCAAFSPNGREVALGCRDHTLLLWDCDKRTTKELKGYRESVQCVAFSRDGRLLVSGGRNGDLLLWNLEDGDPERRLRGHSDLVRSAGFNRDGSRLVSGSNDNTLKIWDVATGQELHTLRGHDGKLDYVSYLDDDRFIESAGGHEFYLWRADPALPIGSIQGAVDCFDLALSQDGKYVATGYQVTGLAVWSTITGQPIATMPGHEMGTHCLSMSRDGRLVISGGQDGCLRFWETTTGRQLRVIEAHPSSVTAVAFSRDESQVVTGGGDGSIRLWNASSGKLDRELRGHTERITDLDFHPQVAELASSSADGTARTWDLTTGRERFQIRSEAQFNTVDEIFTVDYNSTGSRLLTAEYMGIGIWDTSSGNRIKRLDGHAEAVLAARFSPDDRRILSGSADKSIKVWDAEHGEEMLTLEGHRQGVSELAISDDQSLLVSGGGEDLLKIWRALPDSSGSPGPESVRPPPFDYVGPVAAVAYSPDGRLLASFGEDEAIVLREWRTQQISRRIENQWRTLACLAFSPQGNYVLRGTASGHLSLCSTETGKERWRLAELFDCTLSAAFSPDGSLLVTGGIDGVGRVWDAATGSLKFRLRPHAQAVSAVCVSVDGKRIFTGSHDRTVAVWNAATGVHEMTLFGCEAGVSSLVADPDADGVVAGCFDGTVRGWSLAIESLREFNLRLHTPEDSLSSSLVVLGGHPGPVWSLAFPKEGRLFSGGPDGVLSWQAGKPAAKFTSSAGQLRSFALHPTERRLATVAGDRSLREWDPQLLAGSQEFAVLPGYVGDMLSEQDGNQLIAVLANNEDAAVQRLAPSGKLTQVLTIPKSAQSARFQPDAQRVALGFENEVQVWELKTGKQVWQVATAVPTTPWMEFSPSGNRLAVMLDNGSVQIWSAATGEAIATIKRKEAEYDRMSFGADDDHILTATPDRRLQVWEIATGHEVRNFPVNAAVFDISVEPRTRLVVVAGFDNSIRLFDLDTGKQRWVSADHTDIPWFARFSPDGELILSGGQDHTLRLFRTDTGQQLAVVHGHQNNIPIAGFSAREPKFNSASFIDGSLRMTDFGELKPLSEFKP